MNKNDLKRLFDRGTTVTPEKLAILIENIGGGSGIEIVDSVDKLDPNAELGSIASVAVQGNYSETSIRDLYQADISMIDPNAGTLTQPELLSSVISLKVFAPTDTNNIDFELVESTFVLVPRDFSMTNGSMAMIQISPYMGVMAEVITGGNYDSAQQFLLVEGLLRPGDMVNYTINTDQVEAFNAVLANGIDWCYFGNPTSESAITEDQFNTLDLFIKAVSGKPNSTDIYVKEDTWELLHKKDLEKLAKDLKTYEKSKADKIRFAFYDDYYGIQPNVYTTYTIRITDSVSIKLASIQDTSVCDEYILELKCNSTPSSVSFINENDATLDIKWSNGITPNFEAGFTYIISIINGYGVYSTFIN